MAEIISERFGWFEMPAMPDNGGEGAPAADNVRSMGGPVNELGIINNGRLVAVDTLDSIKSNPDISLEKVFLDITNFGGELNP